MICKSIEPRKREQDCLIILFGKFLSQRQQKILDIFEREELSCNRLVAYYQRKRKQENFMSIANMRSGVVNAMNVANKRTKDAKNKGVNMMRAVGKRFLGVNRERNPLKCHACGRLGHIAANYCVTRPCPKCGRYGYSPNNC